MADSEHISVAEISDGAGGEGRRGTRVSLPVVELLTGRGFVTGKSGSGKSNTASVIAENLLDKGFGLLIVDVDGEYYGLKEAYEILHVGGDEECDVKVAPDHAEKLASLALEENVPIILDVSSYLDAEEAQAMLTAVARHLFAKAKKQKQPFLLLVEEVHEYIPENGSVGECGRTLIKIGKRGRKHGLGVCGISQRPADVKKDFITQCDWLVWHRLTWDNDTSVVRRVLDSTYADAVEDLDDGEGFLETDWSGIVRRVQFDRKRTFDAGATPGLDEFERPDLKSVSDDLVSELAEISEERQAREDRIADLRAELDRKNSRIADLEADLQDARDLGRMAEQFVDALLQEVRGAESGRTERERVRESASATPDANADPNGSSDQSETGMAVEASDAMGEDGSARGSGVARADPRGRTSMVESEEGSHAALATNGAVNEVAGSDDDGTDFSFDDSAVEVSDASDAGSPDPETTDTGSDHVESNGTGSNNAEYEGSGSEKADSDDADFGAALEALTDDPPGSEAGTTSDTGGASTGTGTVSADIEGAVEREAPVSQQRGRRRLDPDKPAYVRRLVRDLRHLDDRSRGMLGHYHDQGHATPIGALLESGGGEDRNAAYANNRALRKKGLIEHVGRGQYRHRLAEALEERAEVDLDASLHASYVDWVVEQVAPA
ncbi:MAG: DUF87 domain-containing protein [Haloarculaceae archaeon]